MAFHKIDKDSSNSITNALNLFTVSPTNTSVSSNKTFEILPSNPLTSKPYHFRIYSSNNWIDLTKCWLYAEMRIRKKNALNELVNIDDTDNVAPIQLIGNTFINNMTITINGREIYNSNSLQAYRSYMSYELSYGSEAKQSHLHANGYYGDTGLELESGDGFKNRKELFKNSGTVQLMSKLDADIFLQPLLLVNHCQMDITIMPAESNFLLIAPDVTNTTKYELEILNLKLYLRKIQLMDGLALDMSRRLDSSIAKYTIKKCMMKSFFISPGRYEYTTNIFMDQIPRKVTLGLLTHGDYVGNLKKSCFNFKPFNVREISIIANGRCIPHAPYALDYANHNAVRPFVDLMEAVGYGSTPHGNGITYPQFLKTHCIYSFVLTNSGSDDNVLDLIKNGTTAVEIKFANPVPYGGVTMVVMGEADSLLMIDKNRTIASDTTI
jgi:hypothetical protein